LTPTSFDARHWSANRPNQSLGKTFCHGERGTIGLSRFCPECPCDRFDELRSAPLVGRLARQAYARQFASSAK
jgi:hypothetical protein